MKQNAAKCKRCQTVIVSKHRHDFVSCPCGAIAVDGGNDYWKRSGNSDDFDETFIPNDIPDTK